MPIDRVMAKNYSGGPSNLLQLAEDLELSKEQTYEARSGERLSLHFAHGFWICILPE